MPKVGGRQPQRFMPFTQGARDCVGQTLARLNLSTTLAQLFGSFSFRLAEEVRMQLTGFSRCVALLLSGWVKSDGPQTALNIGYKTPHACKILLALLTDFTRECLVATHFV